MKKTINNNHRPNCGCPSFAIINRTLVNLKLNIDCHKVQTLISSQHFNVNTNSQRVVGIYLLTMHPLLLASLVTTISSYNSYLWLWLLSWWDLIFFDEFTRQTSQVIFFVQSLNSQRVLDTTITMGREDKTAWKANYFLKLVVIFEWCY